MGVLWPDIAKAFGFACARLTPVFYLKQLSCSSVWDNPLIKFMVIAAPRTGSNLLVSMLNSHPEILCHYEIFHWREIYWATGGQGGLSALWARNKNPAFFLRRIYSDSDEKKAVGFKIFPNHNPLILDYCIRQPRIKKIILKRKNYLRTYASHRLAKENKAYTYRPGVSRNPVYIKPRRFLAYIAKNEAFFQNVKNKMTKTGQNFFEIDYSQIKNPDCTAMLLQFLGVDTQRPLTPGLKKQNSERLSDRILNYTALQNSLKGTKYEVFFDDVL